MEKLNASRRNFVKKMAALSAMTTATALFPGILFAETQRNNASKTGTLNWKKAPCRFCGVGCGVLIGIENGKAVAVKGDPNSPVKDITPS
jgi:nitrate reductase NapA